MSSSLEVGWDCILVSSVKAFCDYVMHFFVSAQNLEMCTLKTHYITHMEHTYTDSVAVYSPLSCLFASFYVSFVNQRVFSLSPTYVFPLPLHISIIVYE